jgi:hypothetical protein
VQQKEIGEKTCMGSGEWSLKKVLIEQGFEYVTEIDGTKLFRKRK